MLDDRLELLFFSFLSNIEIVLRKTLYLRGYKCTFKKKKFFLIIQNFLVLGLF